MRRLTMNISSAALVALIMLSWFVAKPARAASTSPGKNSAFESSDFDGFGDIPIQTVPLLTASIVKGKKKQVLMVEATLSSGLSPVAGAMCLDVNVNGVEAEPTGSGGNRFCLDCGSGSCMVTGTWWLDLDAAELAHPGVFINQPLTVTLRGGDGGSPESDAKVTMSVHMQKK